MVVDDVDDIEQVLPGGSTLSILAERIRLIFTTMKIEYSEIVAIVMHLSWAVPILADWDYMSKSPFLRTVTEKLPTEMIISVALVLATYQFFCCAFGGRPSRFIKTNEHQFNWYIARIVGLLVSALYFCFLMFLLSTAQITGGTVLYACSSLACFTGSQKIYKKMRAEFEYFNLKRVTSDIEFLRRVGVFKHEHGPGDT